MNLGVLPYNVYGYKVGHICISLTNKLRNNYPVANLVTSSRNIMYSRWHEMEWKLGLLNYSAPADSYITGALSDFGL